MNKPEITDIVYDTLMQNKQHLQIDLSKVDNQECDAPKGLILFEYEGMEVIMTISVRTVGVWL